MPAEDVVEPLQGLIRADDPRKRLVEEIGVDCEACFGRSVQVPSAPSFWSRKTG